ncbi:alpha/beta hydrolase family protein [Granulicella paludicola]|uniref:alpha/beta hydrolase family protein n=1 Tax=Granulicella paludicola TaxID=474951 RepID=UPI0021DF7C6F|nr:alpha/beta hydrolase [Granulicella paludicola]
MPPLRQRIPGARRLGTSRLAERLRARREAIAERPRIVTASLLAAVLLLGGLSIPFLHAHMQSVAVLDLIADKAVPAPLRPVVSDHVAISELQLPLPSGTVRARMYTPVGHADAPAIIVFHGVHYKGMDEPRMIAFASSLAACGIRVLTPELPGIKDYHVDANSIATIGDSAQWLAQRSHHSSVGVLGLSFSGGLSLLAAADPRWHSYIKFVVTIGSQNSMARVADYYRTGHDARPNGTIEYLPPHEYGALVLEYQHLDDFVPNTADQPAIREVLRAHLYEDAPAERAALAKLTPEQKTLAQDLMATTSNSTHALMLASERQHLDYAATVSPTGHIGHLDTPVYLLHGEADNIIPAAETLWMANELPHHSLKAELISPVLSHLDLDGTGPTAWDELRLVHFFALVLHAAESK